VIVSEVRVTTCRVPLSSPIVMGELRFDAREYLIVEVATDEGVVGLGYGMTREAPLAAIVARNVAPLVLGRDPLMTEAIWQRLYNANLTIGQRGIFMRCLSAVDIALWDIKAQVAGLPLWQLLGGDRDRVPVSMAGGYPRGGVTLDDLGREMDGYAAEGYRWIKIAAGAIEDDTERLRVAAEAIGGRALLAYDAHWAWRDVPSVLPTVQRWRDFDLAFIEDPYPSDLLRPAAVLRERSGIPLALGEDTTGRYAYRDLIDQVAPDYLRVDATTTGGISEALKICALAATESMPVLPHIFPEVHVHLAAALPTVMAVEVTDPAREIDLAWQLLANPMRPETGWLTAPKTAGLGIELDRAAVERFAVSRETHRPA
jgi:L-alanine-DL-glutamate epimerase-like enolase superfamily enzyme